MKKLFGMYLVFYCILCPNATNKRPVEYRLKDLEREPLRHCEGNGMVTFTRTFLMLGKNTFDEQVNVLGRYCKCDVS